MGTSMQVNDPSAGNDEEPGSLEGQLRSLYHERELLTAELGTADADEVIALVRALKLRAEARDENLVTQRERTAR